MLLNCAYTFLLLYVVPTIVCTFVTYGSGLRPITSVVLDDGMVLHTPNAEYRIYKGYPWNQWNTFPSSWQLFPRGSNHRRPSLELGQKSPLLMKLGYYGGDIKYPYQNYSLQQWWNMLRKVISTKPTNQIGIFASTESSIPSNSEDIRDIIDIKIDALKDSSSESAVQYDHSFPIWKTSDKVHGVNNINTPDSTEQNIDLTETTDSNSQDPTIKNKDTPYLNTQTLLITTTPGYSLFQLPQSSSDIGVTTEQITYAEEIANSSYLPPSIPISNSVNDKEDDSNLQYQEEIIQHAFVSSTDNLNLPGSDYDINISSDNPIPSSSEANVQNTSDNPTTEAYNEFLNLITDPDNTKNITESSYFIPHLLSTLTSIVKSANSSNPELPELFFHNVLPEESNTQETAIENTNILPENSTSWDLQFKSSTVEYFGESTTEKYSYFPIGSLELSIENKTESPNVLTQIFSSSSPLDTTEDTTNISENSELVQHSTVHSITSEESNHKEHASDNTAFPISFNNSAEITTAAYHVEPISLMPYDADSVTKENEHTTTTVDNAMVSQISSMNVLNHSKYEEISAHYPKPTTDLSINFNTTEKSGAQDLASENQIIDDSTTLNQLPDMSLVDNDANALSQSYSNVDDITEEILLPIQLTEDSVNSLDTSLNLNSPINSELTNFFQSPESTTHIQYLTEESNVPEGDDEYTQNYFLTTTDNYISLNIPSEETISKPFLDTTQGHFDSFKTQETNILNKNGNSTLYQQSYSKASETNTPTSATDTQNENSFTFSQIIQSVTSNNDKFNSDDEPISFPNSESLNSGFYSNPKIHEDGNRNFTNHLFVNNLNFNQDENEKTGYNSSVESDIKKSSFEPDISEFIRIDTRTEKPIEHLDNFSLFSSNGNHINDGNHFDKETNPSTPINEFTTENKELIDEISLSSTQGTNYLAQGETISPEIDFETSTIQYEEYEGQPYVLIPNDSDGSIKEKKTDNLNTFSISSSVPVLHEMENTDFYLSIPEESNDNGQINNINLQENYDSSIESEIYLTDHSNESATLSAEEEIYEENEFGENGGILETTDSNDQGEVILEENSLFQHITQNPLIDDPTMTTSVDNIGSGPATFSHYVKNSGEIYDEIPISTDSQEFPEITDTFPTSNYDHQIRQGDNGKDMNSVTQNSILPYYNFMHSVIEPSSTNIQSEIISDFSENTYESPDEYSTEDASDSDYDETNEEMPDYVPTIDSIQNGDYEELPENLNINSGYDFGESYLPNFPISNKGKFRPQSTDDDKRRSDIIINDDGFDSYELHQRQLRYAYDQDVKNKNFSSKDLFPSNLFDTEIIENTGKETANKTRVKRTLGVLLELLNEKPDTSELLGLNTGKFLKSGWLRPLLHKKMKILQIKLFLSRLLSELIDVPKEGSRIFKRSVDSEILKQSNESTKEFIKAQTIDEEDDNDDDSDDEYYDDDYDYDDNYYSGDDDDEYYYYDKNANESSERNFGPKLSLEYDNESDDSILELISMFTPLFQEPDSE